MRVYIAACRNQHDEICPVGRPTTAANEAAATARDAHVLEPEVRFFVAYDDEPISRVAPWEWQEL